MIQPALQISSRCQWYLESQHPMSPMFALNIPGSIDDIISAKKEGGPQIRGKLCPRGPPS
eukprot:1356596-Karenia_brevis.AAC.1